MKRRRIITLALAVGLLGVLAWIGAARRDDTLFSSSHRQAVADEPARSPPSSAPAAGPSHPPTGPETASGDNEARWTALVAAADTWLRLDVSGKAIERAQEAVECRSDDAVGWELLARAYKRDGRQAAAAAAFERAVALQPDWVKARNNLAWLLATSPDAEVRDAPRALELSQRLLAEHEDPNSALLDTHAVALAAAGRFPEAIEVAERAIERARGDTDDVLTNHIAKRLTLYRVRRSFVEFVKPPLDEAAADQLLAAGRDHFARRTLLDAADVVRRMDGGRHAVLRLAWMLATHSDPRVRDSDLSLSLTDLVGGSRARSCYRCAEVRAAAQASLGRWVEAVDAANAALRMAAYLADGEADELRERLALYQRRQPLRISFTTPYTKRAGREQSDRRRALAYAVDFVARESLDVESHVTVEWLRTAVRLDPDFAPSRRLLGRLLLEAGRGEAVSHLAAAAKLDPNDAALLNSLGRAFRLVGQHRDAVSAYRRALEVRPGWLPAVNNLAWLLATSSDRSVRDGPQAVTRLNQALADAAEPGAETLDTLAAAQAEAGDFDAAIRTARQAETRAAAAGQAALVAAIRGRRRNYEARQPVRDTAIVVAVDTPDDRDGHLAMARKYLESNQLEAAAAHYVAALDQQPDDPALLVALGVMRTRQGRTAAATALLARAARLQPDHAAALSNLAWIRATSRHDFLHDPEEAVLLVELVFDGQPDAAASLSVLKTAALAYAAVGRFDEAVTAAASALETARASGDEGSAHAIRERLQYYRRGREYTESPRELDAEAAERQRAVEELAALTRHQGRDLPEGPQAIHAAYRDLHVRLGAEFARRGEPARGVRHLRAAIDVSPDASAYNELGRALRSGGHFAEAVDAFAEAIRLDPGSLSAANNLAWTLATRPAVKAADARLAVRVASRVCDATARLESGYLDTLAAAYASAGQFDEAVAVVDQALSLQPADDSIALRRAMLHRKQLYEAGKPFWKRPRVAARDEGSY